MIDEITCFVNWLRHRNPQARTWRDYGYDLSQFVASVGDKPPAAVTLQDVDNFVTAQAARGLKPATINRHLAAVMSLYTFLADEDPDLVCPVLPHTLREAQRLPRPAPEADLHRFFAVIANAQDRAMFLLMLRCGLRIAEVAALHLSDLYLVDSPPRLRVNGKNSKERVVYLSDQARQAVQTYLAARPSTTSDFLFLSYQLDSLSTTAIHKRLMRYQAAADIHLTAHQLRYTFANDLVSADGAVHTCITSYYLPVAGHVLGYHLQPHAQLHLERDLERVMAFLRTKQVSERWLIMGRHALTRFRRFMQAERGENGQIVHFKQTDGRPSTARSSLQPPVVAAGARPGSRRAS